MSWAREVARAISRAIEGVGSAVRLIDEAVRGVDEALASVDGAALSRPLEAAGGGHGYVFSPSYPGQSQEDACVPPDTLVHTRDGLKPISSIKEGEYVLTHKGRFKRVTKVFRRHYSGELISVLARGMPNPIMLTPNHPVLVNDGDGYKWVEAERLTKGDWLVYPTLYQTVDIKELSVDLCKLIGWYLAEGYIKFARVSNRPCGVAFSLGSEDEAEEVISILKSLNITDVDVKRPKRPGRGVCVSVNSFSLASFLLNHFHHGSGSKRIPLWFKLLPVEKLSAMLESYIKGDGHIYRKSKPRFQVTTVSMQLAYDIRDIALKLGFVPMVWVKGEREVTILDRNCKGKPMYVVEFREPVNHKTYQRFLILDDPKKAILHKISELRSDGKSFKEISNELNVPKSTVIFRLKKAKRRISYGSRLLLRIKSVERVSYDGEVYNLEVENDHSYVVRDFVVHNCLECLTRHYLKALGLLEEAERFSINRGEVTPEARQRVELAIKEVVTAEEDLGAEVRDPELAKMIDEIKARQREFRKWAWAERLTTSQRDISRLREAISRMKAIVDLTRRAAEYYDSKYGRCPYCESIAKEVASRFGVDEAEVLEHIYGAASGDRERASRSIERLRQMGVLEYVMKRVREALEGGG